MLSEITETERKEHERQLTEARERLVVSHQQTAELRRGLRDSLAALGSARKALEEQSTEAERLTPFESQLMATRAELEELREMLRRKVEEIDGLNRRVAAADRSCDDARADAVAKAELARKLHAEKDELREDVVALQRRLSEAAERASQRDRQAHDAEVKCKVLSSAVDAAALEKNRLIKPMEQSENKMNK
jgi:chromosome segregation ATPase